jgi:hypothetical protein
MLVASMFFERDIQISQFMVNAGVRWMVGSSVDVASFHFDHGTRFLGIRNRLQPCSKRLLPHASFSFSSIKEYNSSVEHC